MTSLSEEATDVSENECICPACGSPCNSARKFCTKCGSLLEESYVLSCQIKARKKAKAGSMGILLKIFLWLLAIVAFIVIALFIICSNMHFGGP